MVTFNNQTRTARKIAFESVRTSTKIDCTEVHPDNLAQKIKQAADRKVVKQAINKKTNIMTNKQARRELVSNILQSTAEYFNVELRVSGHGLHANPDVISSLITKIKHNLNTLKIFIPSGNEKDKNKTSDAIELYLLKKTKQKTAIIYVANNYFQLDMERSLFIR